jgi:hypothetical protein
MKSRGLHFIILLFLIISSAVAQAPYPDTTCSLASQICSGQTYEYTAWTGSHYAQSGPSYGCLNQQPDPAWFYFMAGNSGNVTIHMSSTPCKDIDYICWGPFDSLQAGCNGGLTADKILSCSYSSACVENCTLLSMVTGKCYILLITNFSTQSCTISFSQVAGTGIMQCIQPPVVTNNGPVCAGQIALLNCSTIPGASYQWTGPNGFMATVQNPIINNTTVAHSGTYSVVVTVGTLTLSPVSTTLIVNPLPTPQIIPSSPLCTGGSISIGGASLPGYSYIWASQPAGFTSALSNPEVSPTVNTTYYLTVTSDQNCTATASTSISLNPVPSVFVFPDATICAGLHVPLGGNPNPNYTYSWTSDPAGFTSSLSNPVVTPLVTTTYTLVVTNQYSCSRTYTVTITVLPAPPADPGTSDTVCLGSTVILGAPPVPGNTYSWNSNPPGFTSNLSNPTVSPAVTTVYTLTVTEPVNGCTAINSVVITVSPLPVVTLQPFLAVCKDAAAFLLTGGDPPGGTYSGQAVADGYFNPSTLSPGIYSIVYSYVNSMVCSGTATQTIQLLFKPKINGDIRYKNNTNTLLDSCKVKLYDQAGNCLDSTNLFNGTYSFKCLESSLYKVKAACQKIWGGGNALDALLVARYAVGLISFTDIQKKVADVNNSGTINSIDSYLIIRRWAGFFNSFPSGDWYITQKDSIPVNNQDVVVNLQALCFGDVDGSYLLSGNNPAPGPISILVQEKPDSSKTSGTFLVFIDIQNMAVMGDDLKIYLYDTGNRSEYRFTIDNQNISKGNNKYVFEITGKGSYLCEIRTGKNEIIGTEFFIIP